MSFEIAGPLRAVRSREPVTLEDGVPKIVRFGGVVVTDRDTGEEVTLRSPVDLDRYGLVVQDITDSRTGLPKAIEVLRLLAVEEDYASVEKPFNLASRKVIESLLPDLSSGAYLTNRYTLIPRGKAPLTRYEIHAAPVEGDVGRPY